MPFRSSWTCVDAASKNDSAVMSPSIVSAIWVNATNAAHVPIPPSEL